MNAIFNLDWMNIESENHLVGVLQRYIKVNQERDPQIEQKVRPAVNAIRFLRLTDWEISSTSLLSDTEIAAVLASLKARGEVKNLPNGLSGRRGGRSLWRGSTRWAIL